MSAALSWRSGDLVRTAAAGLLKLSGKWSCMELRFGLSLRDLKCAHQLLSDLHFCMLQKLPPQLQTSQLQFHKPAQLLLALNASTMCPPLSPYPAPSLWPLPLNPNAQLGTVRLLLLLSPSTCRPCSYNTLAGNGCRPKQHTQHAMGHLPADIDILEKGNTKQVTKNEHQEQAPGGFRENLIVYLCHRKSPL